MAINSFKGINSVLDVVDTIASVESTTVYPRGVLIVNSAGSLKLGDGTTAGGTSVGTASTVAFADITGVPGRDNAEQLVGGLSVKPGFGIRLIDSNGAAQTRSVQDQNTPDVYDQVSDSMTAGTILTNEVRIKDGGKIGKQGNAAGALIPTAGTGYNGPSVKDLVLGSEHGIGVFLDPGNDDSGSAFTIWSNLNPYVDTPGEDNYKLKLNGDTGNLGIAGRVTARGGFRGDLQGSVVADDSTVIVDGVAGTVAAGALTGDLGVVGVPNRKEPDVEIRVNDVFGNPGDGYTDIPISDNRITEHFRIRENISTPATAHAVDLPDLTHNAYGKEVQIYSDGSGGNGNNIVITFTRMTTSGTTEKTSRTLSGNSFGYWTYKWYGSLNGKFWKETQIV